MLIHILLIRSKCQYLSPHIRFLSTINRHTNYRMQPNDDVKVLLGRRIRQLRKIRMMTQEQLGEKAGVDYKYLGGIERGERNPSTENLAKIAKALGVKIQELFIFGHEIDDVRLLKKNIDELLKEANKKEVKTICRVIEAILR
jgi:transcriptional regulator with XRE-family HTH domain